MEPAPETQARSSRGSRSLAQGSQPGPSRASAAQGSQPGPSRASAEPSTTNIATFSLEELQYFTSGFTEMNFLISGGFGSVYKGIIKNFPDMVMNGKKIVVKVSHGGDPYFRLQWEAEIRYLSYISHRNILPLLGQCEANGKFYLVYPYMQRGNVKQNLPGLKWERTLDILIGASLALEEVHRHNLVFRDFKSGNILLDDDWTPLLSDFGTVRPEGEIYAAGTGGYTDPTILLKNEPGMKQTDIFSLGIFILQLITRRAELGMPLKDKAAEEVGVKMHAMDDSLRVFGGCPIEVARGISELALDCVNEDFEARPTASYVHQRLLGYRGGRADKVKAAIKLIPKLFIGVPKTDEW